MNAKTSNNMQMGAMKISGAWRCTESPKVTKGNMVIHRIGLQCMEALRIVQLHKTALRDTERRAKMFSGAQTLKKAPKENLKIAENHGGECEGSLKLEGMRGSIWLCDIATDGSRQNTGAPDCTRWISTAFKDTWNPMEARIST